MIGSSVIAALSAAISYKVDVERFPGLATPTLVYTWVVAGSGSRKSFIDRQIMKVFDNFEREAVDILKCQIAERKAALIAWNANYTRLEKILRSGGPGNARNELEVLLLDKPSPLFPPKLFFKDATIEAITRGLFKWPSGLLSFAEGGSFLNSRAMSKQTFFNEAWDGSDLVVDRASTDSFVVANPRLTVAVMIQEKTFQDFLGGKGHLAEDNGFMSRFLICYPQSLEGLRFNNNHTGSFQNLEIFHSRLREILMGWLPVDGVHPPRTLLKLSPEAHATLTLFSNQIETDLSPGGYLSDLRAHGSKASEHAVRLAALFHYFEAYEGPISSQTMQCATRIVAWYLQEAKRLFGFAPQMPPEVIDALAVETTIRNYLGIRPGQNFVPKAYLFSHSPKAIRNKARLDVALQHLAVQNRIMLGRLKKTWFVYPNPAYFPSINQVNGSFTPLQYAQPMTTG